MGSLGLTFIPGRVERRTVTLLPSCSSSSLRELFGWEVGRSFLGTELGGSLVSRSELGLVAQLGWGYGLGLGMCCVSLVAFLGVLFLFCSTPFSSWESKWTFLTIRQLFASLFLFTPTLIFHGPRDKAQNRQPGLAGLGSLLLSSVALWSVHFSPTAFPP